MSEQPQSLVLRLGAPLQSWGTTSQFNRRVTEDRPSKAGIIGLLGAAEGRRRGDDITDLIGLSLGVRVDQPGSIMHDFHTVSTLDGDALLAAKTNKKGWQVPTSPKKLTHVTRRSYLQDAVFVAVISGDQRLLHTLATALVRPRFPLALGRRSCPPTQPLILEHANSVLWPGPVNETIRTVPWQAGIVARSQRHLGPTVQLSATIDTPDGDAIAADVPRSFDPRLRGYTIRTVAHEWIPVPTGQEADASAGHDPFALLGW